MNFWKDLPKPIRELAESLVDKNHDYLDYLKSNYLAEAFDWCETEQGLDFWSNIDDGDFDVFYEKYPQKEIEENSAYDYVNPTHYKNFNKETIDMMLDIWGKEKLIAHCEMCAFKYRMRLGSKPNQPIERDLEKAKWYETKALELKKV